MPPKREFHVELLDTPLAGVRTVLAWLGYAGGLGLVSSPWGERFRSGLRHIGERTEIERLIHAIAADGTLMRPAGGGSARCP